MTTETLSDVEVDVDLDLEKVCECTSPLVRGYHTVKCNLPAAWLYVFKCCLYRGFVCQEHHLRNITGYYPAMGCNGCQATGKQLSDLVREVRAV